MYKDCSNPKPSWAGSSLPLYFKAFEKCREAPFQTLCSFNASANTWTVWWQSGGWKGETGLSWDAKRTQSLGKTPRCTRLKCNHCENMNVSASNIRNQWWQTHEDTLSHSGKTNCCIKINSVKLQLMPANNFLKKHMKKNWRSLYLNFAKLQLLQGVFFNWGPPNFSTKKKIAKQPITAQVLLE